MSSAWAESAADATSPKKGCECWPTDPKYHFVYYGITEPGSAWEWNPECPAHRADTTEAGQ